MANNGVYYSSGHSLNFTTSSTTWATLTSGGTFDMNAVSATTYYNLPVSGLTGGSNISVTGSNGNYTISYTGTSGTSGDYLPLSGGTVTGATVFQSGLTANTFYTNYIDFNTSSTPVNNEGRLIWNNADEIGGLEVTMMSGNTILQIGEENLARVYNADTVTLTAGTVVYVFGSQGNTISVKRASNSGETTSSRALGVVSESIAVGARGFVNTFGLVKGLNTLAYSGGTPIWLGTTPGSWTSTEPDAPNHTVLIGFVSRSANSPNGSLFVHISNGWELNELHNVYAPSPSDGNILKYSAATSVWVNSNTINLNGVSATTVSATTYQNLPTDIRTTGATYSNNTFTFTNNTGGTYSVLFNTVTGLTVNGGLNVTGQTTSATISATTYLNLPQSVTGSGTGDYIPKWNGSTGLINSQIQDDGSQVYIGANGILGSLFSVVGPVGVNEFQIQAISSSLGITDTDLTTWTTGGNEIAIGSNGPLSNSSGVANIAIGPQSMVNNSTGSYNIAIGRRSLTSNQAGQHNVAIGYQAGQGVDSGSYNVLIGYDAGAGVTTEDNRLYIANNTYGTLIYGEFDNGIVNIDGTLSATTYDNLPGSSSANCFTTFYVTNISGCSPVNVLSPLNVVDGLSVTGTSTFTSQANFTGGISATTFSAATYENLPTDVFVSAGTYSNGQITFTNTTGGTFNVTNIPIGGAGGQPYYFNLSVLQTPYQEFSPSATTASEQTKSVTIASGVTSTFEGFLTPSGYPNVTLVPAGYWSFYLHAYKAAGTTTFDIFCEVYKRTTGGTETLLLSTDPVEVTSIGSASMVISDGYYSGSSINSSDRIVVKVRTTNTGTASSTVTFVTEGTVHYSYGVTPFTNIGNVLGVTATDGISGSSTTGSITLINTDKGSSQNIFKNIQVEGVTQFSAGSNSSNLNFSGINITITSAATNTLVFSAGTGDGVGISGSGTTNYIPKFTGSTGIGNSQLQDNGSQIFTNQGYAGPMTGNLSINASGTTGIAGRATQYGVWGQISGTTALASGVYGEAGQGQYGVFGYNIGDTAGEYVGVRGSATEANGAFVGSVYIGGKFYGFNGTGAGYSVQLEDGTEGVGKFLKSITSDGKANWASLPVSEITAGTGISVSNVSGNVTIGVSLTSTQVFATATTTINAATYIDINGCSVSLAAGTWLITGHVVIAAANLIIQGFVAITTGANVVVAASALSRPNSGAASLNSPFAVSWSVIVSPASPTTYKLRAARGLTTHTSTYTVYNGTGFNTANHANDGSNLGTNILAIRIA